MSDDLSQYSMLDLFRVEAEQQTGVLMVGLLELERQGRVEPAASSAPGTPHSALLDSLMRAAHSLKGAARIVNLPAAVSVAHALEDCFVAAQKGRLAIGQKEIDVFLRGVDLLSRLAKEAGSTEAGLPDAQVEQAVAGLRGMLTPEKRSTGKSEQARTGDVAPSSTLGLSDSPDAPPPLSPPSTSEGSSEPPSHSTPATPPVRESQNRGTGDIEEQSRGEVAISPARPLTDSPQPERVLRLNAANLNRLLGLAGETLVESRWLHPFTESLERLKRMQGELEGSVAGLRQLLQGESGGIGEVAVSPSPALTVSPVGRLNEILERVGEARGYLAERMVELDQYERRTGQLASRLYVEVLRTRMRPFSDGVGRLPRMVRDLGRELNKVVRLEVRGENTPVDRDILEGLERPLGHLLRNAVDHGCEKPEERVRAGKPVEGIIKLQARHSAGMLLVEVSDDGAGVDLERVRAKIVERGMTSAAEAQKLGQEELLDFLFLPGFTVKEAVTEISGRGVGLDVVASWVKELRGTVRVSTAAGRGVRFVLQLPLTLSVLRALLVEVGGEAYAFPLGQVVQALRLPRGAVQGLEGLDYFSFGEQHIGLVSATQVLGMEPPTSSELETQSTEHRSCVLPFTTHPAPPAISERGTRNSERGTSPDDLCVIILEGPRTEGRGRITKVSSSPQSAAIDEKGEANEMETGGLEKSPSRRPAVSQVSSAPSDLSLRTVGARSRYGLVVGRFLGERELVVQPLDVRLGKVQDISAAALLEDGAPVLIVDVEEMVRSIEKLVAGGEVHSLEMQDSESGVQNPALGAPQSALRQKRVLAVDDSLTVRELERKLLSGVGYAVEVACDGMEAWHALREGRFDLVITDVDMPRMDGIELTRLIRKDVRLRSLPVVIVSYKDRQEERARGLEAGADYYLTKGSFHDESLLRAVADLIGESEGSIQ